MPKDDITRGTTLIYKYKLISLSLTEMTRLYLIHKAQTQK